MAVTAPAQPAQLAQLSQPGDQRGDNPSRPLAGAAPDTLVGRFRRGLGIAAGRAAIRLDTDEQFSYERVHELAASWAGALRVGADEPPRVVGVLAAKGIEAYAGILAALYAGATVVPLHAEFPVARTDRMLRAAGVQAVVADRAGLAVLTESSWPRAGLPVLAPDVDACADERLRLIDVGPRHALDEPVPVAPDDVAYVLFTSGSTGRPKGVPLTHAMIGHYFRLADRRYDFTADDMFSQTFDLNFDCAMFDMFCAWNVGAAVAAVPASAYLDLPAFVTQRRLTVWFAAPSSISFVRRVHGLGPGTMPTLRWSLFAGEALQARDVVDWRAAASGCTVENIYGPTELTLTVTAHRWDPSTSPGLCVNGLVPIGTLHDGHDCLLLTPDGGESEHEGELCVAGPQLTPGYLDPQDDAGRFLRRAGRTWYRTGDRVRRLDNGELIYLGRLDSQVQVLGWRVELAEIEHALRGCAGVTGAVAVTRPATTAAGLELVAFYTGAQVPAVELARALRRILPKGMLPRHYRHVEEFPLNSNRKIDRARLAELAAEDGR